MPVGELGEKLFKQYLTDYKKLDFIRKSEDRADLKHWDLEFSHNGNFIKYEIKTDVFIKPDAWVKIGDEERLVEGRDTGNMFVEFSSRDSKSGISTTTADVWVNIFFHLREMWVIRTEMLKKLIDYSNFKIAYNSGDEGSKTAGYLIPRRQFQQFFKVIPYELSIKQLH